MVTIVVFIVIFDLIEFEIKQCCSDFCKTRSAFSRSLSLMIVTVGSKITSVIKNFPSTCSSFPLDLQEKAVNSNLEFSAMDKKVVIRQLATADVNKCSGYQIPSTPFGNCGGVICQDYAEVDQREY